MILLIWVFRSPRRWRQTAAFAKKRTIYFLIRSGRRLTDVEPRLSSRISIPIQNTLEYSRLLVSGVCRMGEIHEHRGGDHGSAPYTCARVPIRSGSARLLWCFESHGRNRLHNRCKHSRICKNTVKLKGK